MSQSTKGRPRSATPTMPPSRCLSLSKHLAINEGVARGITAGGALQRRAWSRCLSISKDVAINEGAATECHPYNAAVGMPLTLQTSRNQRRGGSWNNCRDGTPWPPLVAISLSFQRCLNQRRGGLGVPPLQCRRRDASHSPNISQSTKGWLVE